MQLEGKIFKENRLICQNVAISVDPQSSFVELLESNLIILCKQLNIPVPIWLSKNTHEFAAFKQTIFFSDQFTEHVLFDRFQIKLL